MSDWRGKPPIHRKRESELSIYGLLGKADLKPAPGPRSKPTAQDER